MGGSVVACTTPAAVKSRPGPFCSHSTHAKIMAAILSVTRWMMWRGVTHGDGNWACVCVEEPVLMSGPGRPVGAHPAVRALRDRWAGMGMVDPPVHVALARGQVISHPAVFTLRDGGTRVQVEHQGTPTFSAYPTVYTLRDGGTCEQMARPRPPVLDGDLAVLALGDWQATVRHFAHRGADASQCCFSVLRHRKLARNLWCWIIASLSRNL